MVVSAIMSAEGFSLYLAVSSAMFFAAMTFFGIKNKKSEQNNNIGGLQFNRSNQDNELNNLTNQNNNFSGLLRRNEKTQQKQKI